MKNKDNRKSPGKLFFAAFLGILLFVGAATSVSAQKPGKKKSLKNRAVATKASVKAAQKSLYERLGGYEAISAVVEVFADKLFDDPVVGKFFVGMGTDTKKQFKQKNKNLVCNVTGGPCQIISRSAKTTHAGLGITEQNFQIVVQHLIDTLNEFRVPAKEQKELLDIIGTLKPDIVEKK